MNNNNNNNNNNKELRKKDNIFTTRLGLEMTAGAINLS